MVGTVMCTDALQTTDLQDNTTGLITASDVRNFAESAFCVVLSPNGTQTASYTAVLTDRGACVPFNVASGGANYTVPPNSSVAFPVGAVLTMFWVGTIQPVWVAGAGVTINTASSLTLRTHYSFSSVWQYAANTWVAMGDLSP